MANTTAQLVLNSLRAILEHANNTGSVNFYMAHGGTNFGYWAGAPLLLQIMLARVPATALLLGM